MAGMLLILWISGLIFSGCAPHLPARPGPEPQTYKAKVAMRIHGFQRTYKVHLPAGYRADNPLPMVIIIHGAFDTGKNMERVSGFSKLADKEKFIAVYPEGMGIFGFIQHWNAGHCCGKAAADQIDDVGFLEAVIENACSRLAVDRRRIYMTGFSNGGMLVHRFASEKGHLLAAAAPMAASAGGSPNARTPEWSPQEANKTIPMLSMHGTSDLSVPFEGTKSIAGKDTRRYWAAEQSMAFWVRQNDCEKNPLTESLYQGQVKITTWKSRSNKADVVLYAIDGWGHQWPGRFFTSRLAPENPLHNFDAAEIIWDFFKVRQRKQGGSIDH